MRVRLTAGLLALLVAAPAAGAAAVTGAGRTWWETRTGIATWWTGGRGRDRAFVSGNDGVRRCERVELGSPD